MKRIKKTVNLTARFVEDYETSESWFEPLINYEIGQVDLFRYERYIGKPNIKISTDDVNDIRKYWENGRLYNIKVKVEWEYIESSHKFKGIKGWWQQYKWDDGELLSAKLIEIRTLDDLYEELDKEMGQ